MSSGQCPALTHLYHFGTPICKGEPKVKAVAAKYVACDLHLHSVLLQVRIGMLINE